MTPCSSRRLSENDSDCRKPVKVYYLVDLRPASIRKLLPVGEIGFRPLGDLFDGLVESKAQDVPKLEAIDCDYPDPACGICGIVEQAFHVVGVELWFEVIAQLKHNESSAMRCQ